jgi:drug/metabolite transporter (DMT)-like permease
MIQTYIWIALVISFLFGIQTVIHKHLLNHISGMSVMLYSAIVYTVLIMLSAYYTKSVIIKDLKKIDLRISAILFFSAVFTAYLTNVLYYYILKTNDSSIISTLISSSPVFTVIFAYLFLKEKISLYGFIGIISIIIGVILINKDNKDIEYVSHY